MSYHEKRSIVGMLSSLLVFGLYTWYMYHRLPALAATDTSAFKAWGLFMVLLVPVSIVSKILVQIVFIIFYRVTTQEEEPDFEDERDKLIELRATRNSQVIFVIAFFVAMLLLALGQRPGVMFMTMIIGGLLAEMSDHLSKFCYYQRGF